MLKGKYLFVQIGMRLAILLGCFFVMSDASAAAVTALTLTTLQKNMAGGMQKVIGILQDVSMVTGIGFIMSSFFKFHQHKMNPTQVGLSQGVTLLVIGAGLTIFPHLVGTVAKSGFGETAGTGSVTAIVNPS